MLASPVLLLAVPTVLASVLPLDSSQTPLALAKNRTDKLTFDDIFSLPLPSINSSLPALNTTYHNLNFTSFSLFNTSSPPTGPPPLDNDCAFSGTNALVASRQPGKAWPRFLLDPKVAREKGIAPFFNLHGFAQKHVGFVKTGTRLWIQALGVIDHGEDTTAYPTHRSSTLPHKVPIKHTHGHDWAFGRYEIVSSYTIVSIVQQDGHERSFYFNFSELFPGWGEMVNMVEVYAEAPTGEDEEGLYTGFEDWMFCIDDLVVEWLDVEVMGEEEVESLRSDGQQKSRFMHVEVGSGLNTSG